MKKLSVVFLLMLSMGVSLAQRIIFDGCKITRYYASVTREFYAYGDVYIETDPKEPVDMCVKVVSDIHANMWIYKTTDQPQDCGEWRFVKDRSKAKFTIRLVNELEDCTIRFVPKRSDAGCWGYRER